MAEFAASLIGIVSAGTKVTLVLTQLASDVGSAGKEARMIANEIRSFCAVLKTLRETLEKVQSSQYYSHCAEMTKDMTEVSLEMFTEILNATESVRSMSKGKGGKFGFVSRVQWAVFQKPKMTMLRAALEAYKSNLALMLGTLNTAEKVGRRMTMDLTLDVLVEEENDRDLLQKLESEHRRSLVDVEQASNQLKEDIATDTKNSNGLNNVSGSNAAQQSPIGIEAQASADSVSDTLVESAREEIESVRSSVSRASTFDIDHIEEQVSRYSRRLTILISEDQTRLSQRWSTILPPPGPSQFTYQSAWSDTNVPFQYAFDSDRERHGSSSRPADWQWQDAPAMKAQSNSERASVLSDTFYDVVRTWLMEKPMEDRRVILGNLMNDACVAPPKSPKREGSQFPPIPSPNIKINPLMHVPWDRPSAQYRQKAKEINGWVKNAVREFEETRREMRPLTSTGDNPGLTIDLGSKDIEFLPGEIIEVLRGHLERLAISHNRLVDVPKSMAMCYRLRYLNIRYNQLKTFPKPILDMPALEILDISRNRLKVLPETIWRMQHLKILAIQKNKIQRLPGALDSLNKLQVLKFEGNPLVYPAPNVIKAVMNGPDVPQGSTETEREVYQTAALKRYLGLWRRDDDALLTRSPVRSGRFPVVPAQPSPPPSSWELPYMLMASPVTPPTTFEQMAINLDPQHRALFRPPKQRTLSPLQDSHPNFSRKPWQDVPVPFSEMQSTSPHPFEMTIAPTDWTEALSVPPVQGHSASIPGSSSHQRSQSQDPQAQTSSLMLSPPEAVNRRRSHLDTRYQTPNTKRQS
ncbi:hypothetical protein CC80DRAFT_540596 [Byssothecium circinans]|uniref:Disease resistance R13L4/SHOC-2-like LRR domain-containing protein n=1 Tax=Byssothecium circinans TaxID=147558 RepID=A0A6A5TBF0_9PLEO|nr:hypothetical protein CC80DRAFT_540596 [Byssothecium circinans]